MQCRGGKQLILTGIPIFQGEKIKWVFVNERDVTELNLLKNELERLKEESNKYNTLIIESKPMKKIMVTLSKIASTDISVLIEGESGTGKGIIAKWIHDNSTRKDKAFVKIDCGSLPESLLESELFGYVSGAFTGASKQGKIGLVETAASGTLFLDEVGEMPLSLQVKLLRLIQEQLYIPIGATSEKKVDIRIIAATNRDLSEMVSSGTFRADLFYRLKVIPVKLPPLSEREEDIFPLLNHYLEQYNLKYNCVKKFRNDAVKLLCKYTWPGNIRELSNVVERLVVVTGKNIIDVEDVEEVIDIKYHPKGNWSLSYQAAKEEFEREYILNRAKEVGTIAELANILGVSLSTMKRKLSSYKIKLK